MKAIEIDDGVLRRMWAARVHAEEIGAHFGCSAFLIYRRAKSLGLTRRDRGRALPRSVSAKQAPTVAAQAAVEGEARPDHRPVDEGQRRTPAAQDAGGSGGGTDTAGGAVPRGLTLAQAVALDGGTWAGRARIAARFGVPTRAVEQLWHRHRADRKVGGAG